MNNESDDEGFLNEAEILQQKEAKRFHQEQVQWMKNGETSKTNYQSIPLSVGPEAEDNQNKTSWFSNPRYYAGIVMVVVALIFVAICREAFVAPPTMQEMSPGIVAEDATRHHHKTPYPTRFPTHAPLPTFLPTLAPNPTLVPSEAPPTMQPSEVAKTLPPTATEEEIPAAEEEPTMPPTEASTMVLIEGASYHKKTTGVPTMFPTQTPFPSQTPIPSSFPTAATPPTMYPTDVPIPPTTLPTEVPSMPIHQSPVSVINHVIGGVAIVGLLTIGVLYGLYYWGWFGNKTADDGHFVALK